MLIGKSTMPLLMQSGKLKLEGNKKIVGVIKSLIKSFTPDFEIIPGTASETAD
jgi:ubiquinone biosynthesis protein UbiJ